MKCTWSFNSKEHFILSVEIQNEIRVNLINESRWHHLSSFCSGAAELDATAPLPPSNKYMDNCWPPLLDTLTSCLNNCGGTQLGQVLLLLLAVWQLLPILNILANQGQIILAHMEVVMIFNSCLTYNIRTRHRWRCPLSRLGGPPKESQLLELETCCAFSSQGGSSQKSPLSNWHCRPLRHQKHT